MLEESTEAQAQSPSADRWLAQANHLLPAALATARAGKGFPGRWRTILSLLDRLPGCLASLSTHPCFSKNVLCGEQLNSVCKTLEELINLAASPSPGKLQTQNKLDSVAGSLEMALRDCNLLIKTEVLVQAKEKDPDSDFQELLARLQLGHAEAKHRALDSLLEAMKEDLSGVVSVLSRRSVAALVQLLSAGSSKVREKAVAAVCSLAESGSLTSTLLVSEGAVLPLVRLAETGSKHGKEKAVFSLERLSLSKEGATEIVSKGGIGVLAAAAAAAALRNLAAVEELRGNLAEEGAVEAMAALLGREAAAAEFMESMTAGGGAVGSGALAGLLRCLAGGAPAEAAAAAVRNLAGGAQAEEMVRMGLVGGLANVLRVGSSRAKQAAAWAVWKVSAGVEMKRELGEKGFVAALAPMLGEKEGGAREAAAAALASLLCCPQNAAEVKRKAGETVPRLVHLLEPGGSAKKHAVCCLLVLSPSGRCRKLMVSYGAVGYLKKLSEMGVPGSRKLLGRLQKSKIRSFFSRR
ncbi:uncharacterized protein LOC144711744 [Wolffia australiana]